MQPPVATFPDLVVDGILGFVPVADRIGSCSLVSKQFRKAAAAATKSVSKDLQANAAATDSLQIWLQQHGKRLSNLQLSSPSQPLTTLPCDNLSQLDLSECRVQWQQPGILDSATGLSKLTLKSCLIVDDAPPDGVLAPLVRFTGLQHLDISLAQPIYGQEQANPAAVLPSSLQQLTLLTHLGLSGHIRPTHDFFSSLPALTALQQLTLMAGSGFPRGRYSLGIQSLLGLRKLQLGLFRSEAGITCEHMSDFRRLTALEHLRLIGVPVEVAALPECPGLIDLQLDEVICAEPGAPLLAYIGRHTQLSRLHLCAEHVQSWPEDAAAYTALTASSNLKHLSLTVGSSDAPGPILDLPAAGWEQVLGPGLQQGGSQLQSLSVSNLADHTWSITSSSRLGLLEHRYMLSLLLSDCVCDPAALGSLTQLTQLQLFHVTIDSLDQQQSSDTAAGHLLHLLSLLQQLQHLEMGSISLRATNAQPMNIWVPVGDGPERLPWPPAAPAYTALLASSSLQHLSLYTEGLPEDAMQYALTVQHQLPQLTALHVGSVGAAAPTFDTATIAALVTRAATLQRCNFTVAPGANLELLGQLASLESLTATVFSSNTVKSITALASCKGLRELCLRSDQVLQSQDFVALTVLKQLHQFGFCFMAAGAGHTNLFSTPVEGYFSGQTGLCDSPPVWVQLQQWYDQLAGEEPGQAGA